MAERPRDLVIVGAGPAGLCAAGAARARGWEPLIVERGQRTGGAWQHLAPDLRCLSDRQHDLLPDGSYPAGDGLRATAAEVLAWLDRYATRESFDVSFGVSANGLRREEGELRLVTTNGEVATRRLVVATGEYSRPVVPDLAGFFAGPADHARDVDLDAVEPDEHVLLVGTGNSAVDLLPRLLARGARVTVSVRTPMTERPDELPTGARARLLWEASALPVRLLPPRLRCTDRVPAVDPDLYDAIASGSVGHVGEAIGLEDRGVRVAGGEVIAVDRVVWATGFRRDFSWLPGIRIDPTTGIPEHREGISADLPGVGFLGLPCMRTRRSGFLRGFADDAAAVLDWLS